MYTLISRIEDEAVRTHYRREVTSRLAAAWGTPAVPERQPYEQARSPKAFGAPRNFSDDWRTRASLSQRGPGKAPARGRSFPGARGGQFPPPLGATSALKKSALVPASGAALPPYREALLLRTILNHPWLIDEQAEAIAGIDFTSAALSRLRDEVLSAQALDISLDTETLHTHLTGTSAGKALFLLERALSHKCDKFAEPDAGRTEVEDGWRHTLAMHERHVGLSRSLEAAEKAWLEDLSEEAFARICELQRQLEHVMGADEIDNPQRA